MHELTVLLFTDIAGSVELQQRLGTDAMAAKAWQLWLAATGLEQLAGSNGLAARGLAT